MWIPGNKSWNVESLVSHSNGLQHAAKVTKFGLTVPMALVFGSVCGVRPLKNSFLCVRLWKRVRLDRRATCGPSPSTCKAVQSPGWCWLLCRSLGWPRWASASWCRRCAKERKRLKTWLFFFFYLLVVADNTVHVNEPHLALLAYRTAIRGFILMASVKRSKAFWRFPKSGQQKMDKILFLEI